jgi:hypothetical protein
MNMNASQPTRAGSYLLSGGCVLPTISERARSYQLLVSGYW